MESSALRRGVRDVAPLLPGIVPFGMVVGIAAVNAGLHLGEAVSMSVVVFAGASQLAAIELLETDAPLLIVNASEVNFADNEADYEALLEEIQRTRSGRHFFNPAPLVSS